MTFRSWYQWLEPVAQGTMLNCLRQVKRIRTTKQARNKNRKIINSVYNLMAGRTTYTFLYAHEKKKLLVPSWNFGTVLTLFDLLFQVRPVAPKIF